MKSWIMTAGLCFISLLFGCARATDEQPDVVPEAHDGQPVEPAVNSPPAADQPDWSDAATEPEVEDTDLPPVAPAPVPSVEETGPALNSAAPAATAPRRDTAPQPAQPSPDLPSPDLPSPELPSPDLPSPELPDDEAAEAASGGVLQSLVRALFRGAASGAAAPRDAQAPTTDDDSLE